MRSYKQLTGLERHKVYVLVQEHKSALEIAYILGRSKSTITRELKRHKGIIGYLPDTANRLAKANRRKNISKIKTNLYLQNYVIDGLKKHWSPEQIAGRMKTSKQPFYACPQTIYSHIYQDRELTTMLPQKGAKKWKRPPHPADFGGKLIYINHRPKPVWKRSSYGHWEGDTIFFTHRTKQNMTVLVERKSRLTVMIKNENKEATPVLYGIKNALNVLPKKAKQTITLDQGYEFTNPLFFKNTVGIEPFYCNKGQPWQKGTVENTNGRIRRFLPKNTVIENYQKQDVEKIVNVMNNTPRKVLGFKTPSEVWNKFINRCTSF